MRQSSAVPAEFQAVQKSNMEMKPSYAPGQQKLAGGE
jgi:hypothetical protein